MSGEVEKDFQEIQIRMASLMTGMGEPVLKLLDPKPGERILDMGCGLGVLAEEMVKMGCEVVAIDVNSQAVEATRQRNVDARLIMQVVVNLVDNAIKYTPVGSVIQISAYRKDHQVVVEVADNGPGIPDRAKAQVFEMFYTGQSRIADSHRSLGLGLPLCRAILTAHGGTLTLRDNIPNGSVFSFALPQSEVNIHE